MNHPSLTLATTIHEKHRGERDTRLHGRRLFLARVFWVIVAIFELAELVDGLAGNATLLQVVCSSSCTNLQLSAAAVRTLERVGLSLGDYVAFSFTVIIISTLLSYAIAALLVWRRSDDWMALLVSLMLMGFGPGTISNGVRFSQWFGPALAAHVSSFWIKSIWRSSSSSSFSSLLADLYRAGPAGSCSWGWELASTLSSSLALMHLHS